MQYNKTGNNIGLGKIIMIFGQGHLGDPVLQAEDVQKNNNKGSVNVIYLFTYLQKEKIQFM